MVKRSRLVAFFLLVLLVGGVIGATYQGIAKDLKLGLDLQGGFEILYQVKPLKKGEKVDEKVIASTVEALDRRINALGVSEPNIQPEGKDRVRVQLAGVKDQNKAREILSTTAKLTFRDVNDKLLMDGSALAEGGAKQSFDENGQPNVAIKLKSASQFKKVTSKVLAMSPDNLMVIWLDFEEGKDSYKSEAAKQKQKFISAASVREVLDTTDVTITGTFTVEEAKELASLLNAGALPVDLKELYSTSVGAKFGQEALHKTVVAGIISILVIFAFMIYFYRLPGIVASITLTLFVYLILQVFDWMNGVLTLPGIAALILGVGIAVDANIITYERMKEELKTGKSLMSAFRSGNQHSFWTIFDSNLTTVLAAAVLFIYGTSSVKGFATMLLVSTALSFLTAVYGSRIFLGLLVNSKAFHNKPWLFGVRKDQIFDIKEAKTILDIPSRYDNIDFVKHSKKFFTFSLTLLVAGLVILGIFRMNLSIDFTSGTRVEVGAKSAINVEQLTDEFKKFGHEPKEIVLAGKDNATAVARFQGVFTKKEINELKQSFGEKYGKEPNISTVSPIVGKELARNAIIAVILSSIGIVIYVAFRFEWEMGITAIVALFHDAFVIIAVFSIFRLEVDLTFIAAVLTIIGYSINDTIVTFDRVKENMKKMRAKTREDLQIIVNKSLSQTLSRSVKTVFTVIITVLAMIAFGSEAILNFNIALLAGLVTGVYSSLFIAAQLWVIIKAKRLNKRPKEVIQEA